jgi:hypothetical protein
MLIGAIAFPILAFIFGRQAGGSKEYGDPKWVEALCWTFALFCAFLALLSLVGTVNGN